MRAEGWMSCDAFPRSRPRFNTVRPACRCCHDHVVVANGAACLPTTFAPASGQTALHPKRAAAAGIYKGTGQATATCERLLWKAVVDVPCRPLRVVQKVLRVVHKLLRVAKKLIRVAQKAQRAEKIASRCY